VGRAAALSSPAAPRGVLWDVDGTLVDSAEHHYQAWRATMDEYGRRFDRAEFSATFGQRNDAILRRTLGPQVTAHDVQRIGDAKEARYRELVRAGGIAPLPGVREWLERLHASACRQAIASSGPALNAQTVIAALDLVAAFDAVVSAEDVPHGKPEPDVFLAAAARLGVAPARCVVVEDAPAGVEAGWRGGMRTLGVLTTHSRLDADRTVRSLADLEPDAFDSLLGR
jgi:beta-phosphoglucomutase